MFKHYSSTKKLLYLALLIIFLAGCQGGCRCNGCTTKKTIEKETDRRKVQGVKLKITANKVQSTNRKLNLRSGEELVSKSVYFSVDYDVKLPKRDKIEHICEFPLVDQNYNLETALTDFTFEFSEDKKNFAVGQKADAWEFYHMLEEGIPFSSGAFYFSKVKSESKYNAVKFSEIDWNIFPPAKQLFDTLLLASSSIHFSGNYNPNQKVLLKLLKEMPPGNSHEYFLIDNWYSEIAHQHFTQSRIEDIVKKSPAWKKTAIKKSLLYLQKENSFGITNTLELILNINDIQTIHKADSIAYFSENIKEYASQKYLLERIEDKKVELNPKIKSDLISRANVAINNLEPESDYVDIDFARKVLIATEDYKSIESAIDKINDKSYQNSTEENNGDGYRNLLNVTKDGYRHYPDPLKKKILKEFVKFMHNTPENISEFELRRMYWFLNGKIPCDEFENIYKENPLINSSMIKQECDNKVR